MIPIRLEDVRAALALDDFNVRAAQRRMAPRHRRLRRRADRPGQPRQAGVLVLLYPAEAGLTFALIQRTSNPHDAHSGQISLPGGAREGDETPIETALREAREELGINGPVEIIGSLTCLYITPSDFEVRPAVGYVEQRPVWVPDHAEVVEVIECPLGWLLDDDHKRIEDWDRNGEIIQVPWYDVHGHKVWGATAIILSEFEHRLRVVIDGRSG
jgi:8-oxo-dGTP pyrophosphatase MutT (NUDIX family)